ncbi:MFS transporter [Xylanimonas ulmi]|uniref:GPH family glycoside/pentoside/hexuronide:cation symporter n=1 Tax=Xylanimonas ulmi TaxID=228973 RepID=A0A4Q7LZN6_9MICO|nr:MFS transporter [Xylanibacterium ulmi]RZS60043.1 GPH family glycoside/pentoside/hexuronide:cation symporter [Xylanibacterium ulmi]
MTATIEGAGSALRLEKPGEEHGFYRLTWTQRIGFGSGDLAQNLIYNTVSTYLLFFYTEVFGLSAAAAATMFLAVRLIDVVWDPIVGAMVDKHSTPWGRYRGYLVIAGIPLSALAVLVFWTGMSGSLVYAYVTYVGLSMLYTLLNVPYGALNSSLTRDNDEISVLTTTRMFLANIGGLAVAFGVPVLVRLFSADGHWDTPAAAGGWLTTMAIYAAVGLAVLVFTFTQTKERVVMDDAAAEQVRVSDLATEFRRNQPLRVVAFFFITAFAMMSVGNAGAAYYMNDVVRAEGAVQWFNALGVLPAFVFLPLVPRIKRRVGKKPLFIGFLAIAIAGMAMLYLIPNPAEHVGLVMAAQFVRSTGVIVATGYMWSLIPEVVSYGEWRTGRRISGIVNALTGIFFKAGMALGGVVPGVVLAITGYRSDAGTQSHAATQGILWLVSVIPAALLVVAMVVISRYDLDDDRLTAMNAEIEQRAASDAAAA